MGGTLRVLTDLLAEVPGSQESEPNDSGIAEEVPVADPLCADVRPLAVCSLLNIQHIQTTANHLQSNGMVERFHRRLKDGLPAHCAVANWVDCLPAGPLISSQRRREPPLLRQCSAHHSLYLDTRHNTTTARWPPLIAAGRPGPCTHSLRPVGRTCPIAPAAL
jgi:hypothetical protein